MKILNMEKIPFNKLRNELYFEEKEIFLDSLKDYPKEERSDMLEEFERNWANAESLEDLVEILSDLGFDTDEAYERMLKAVVDFD
jgi:hypothetical protein